MHRLPKVLAREPLVDALFEVRLSGTSSLADILPGVLFHELAPKPTVMRLPAADIPQAMRASDPGLQFAPVLRLEWSDYFIAVGDQNIIISCKLPYPKWPNFKKAILKITGMIARAEISGKVERYSFKYVNLIQGVTLEDQISKIKMAITLGPVEVRSDHVNLQVHRKEGDVAHILSAIIGARAKLPDGREVSGAIVDIDSIRDVDVPDFATFRANLEPELEELRQANKVKFFGCLTDAAIIEMGPIYE